MEILVALPAASKVILPGISLLNFGMYQDMRDIKIAGLYFIHKLMVSVILFILMITTICQF